MTEFSQSATPEHGARMALEGCCSVLWCKWRALRDSNRCFRRERDDSVSMVVRGRLRKGRQRLTNCHLLCTLVCRRPAPYIGPILGPTR
jgi:hypothetical protein